MKTLCTDSSYQPLAVVCPKRALVLVMLGKADLLETYDAEMRSPSTSFKVPAVIRLRSYFAKKRRMSKFSKKAVCMRDRYECGYCNKRLGPKEVTFDHVVPKSKDGPSSWENIITACYECNIKKGCRTPQEANMPLLKKPYEPTYLLGIDSAYRHQDAPPQWDAWLPR